ncbi:MAG: KH domain-containing protein [Candidatus Peribacteraceae bacterium]|nr:KH domain-containing protein [Candidatus Peribacteraceae bacterium]
MLTEILGNLLSELKLSFSAIDISKEEDITRVDITSTEASKIIGWHGETLNSLQHLVKAIIRSKENLERSPFIVLDVDGYRKAQEDKVKKLAEQKADFVRRTGNRVALAPMSPYFRRIVHLHIAGNEEFSDLETESSGEGDYRQIILKLKDEKGKSISSAKKSDDEELSPVMEEDDLGNLDV